MTKDHKEQLLTGAKILQDQGDNLTTAGLAGATVGVVGGVTAAPGLAVATFGGAMNTAGTILEIGVKLITQDEEATGDIGVFIASKATSAAVNAILPGPNKNMSKEIKGAIKTANKTIGTIVDKKVETVSDELRK